jgi:hypothetical protein
VPREQAFVVVEGSHARPIVLKKGRRAMVDEVAKVADLDRMQAEYKKAVDEWVDAIRKEEALASVNHNVAEVDKWEAAYFQEYSLRRKVRAAKVKYEDALRRKFFDF